MKNHSMVQIFSTTIYCLALLLSAGSEAFARTNGKIPREVIDETADHGTAAVLVGLNVPWKIETRLSEYEVNAQRAAIASVQNNLLGELTGRQYKVIRRYRLGPGIALEVGADALQVLARSDNVTSVLLDRWLSDSKNGGPGTKGAPARGEKVPLELFKRAASSGTVLVLAGLRAPWKREDQLGTDLLALQREGILDAQRYVLAELAGTQYQVTRLYMKVPGIALRVGLDALHVLERSPAVTNVLLDRATTASR
jgi:hypothetical protein